MSFHPRQQMKRDRFMSLDGTWSLNGQPIEVPYCPESRASGYQGTVTDTMIYRRSFELPRDFVHDNDKVLLHFQAVDQRCEVLLNGQSLGSHEGGYLPFEFDITGRIRPVNELEVRVIDDLSDFYPYGKQTLKPQGMWYTKVSGIWQSVWLEAYDRDGIDHLEIWTDDHTLKLHVDTPSELITVVFEGYEKTFDDRDITIDIPQPHLWSPEDPWLYELNVSTAHDVVHSYFGLRKITAENGILKLNGQPLFLNGLLDQGYHPDSILTLTPQQLEDDVRNIKALGYNTLRKHIKVESDAFYYWCDRYGILVLQDFVNSGRYSFFSDTILPTVGMISLKRGIKDRRRYEFFLRQAEGTISLLKSHPSLIGYTIYNEGWGQQGASEAYDYLKKLDPDRLFDSTSGWFHDDHSDFDSYHVYFRTKILKGKGRLLFLSECGGFTRAVEGHLHDASKSYGYGKTDSEETLTEKIRDMYRRMVLPSIKNGLMGCIYTQISDVETEINGLYTYDRQVCKVTRDEIIALNKEVQQAYEEYAAVHR